jgi:NAD(P)-dependent dehydrogenase (short-subunit alcohol dehydrogenase family)
VDGLLKGRVAIISGATHGIGEAETRVFCRHGARVVVGGILDDEGLSLVRELNADVDEPQAAYIHLDVRDSAAWDAAVHLAESSFGKLTTLVNNAGVPARSGIEDTTDAEWTATIDVDLKGTWLGMKACIPAMRRAGGGAIVNTSSHYGLVASGRAITYHTAKGGVLMLTKAAAAEYAGQNIRINAIHPGLTDTVRIASLPPAWRQSLLDSVPLKRIAAPEEVANAVMFLASDLASYMTGSSLIVDGGLTAI